VHQGEAAQLQAFVLGERLRDAGLDVIMHGDARRRQLQVADEEGRRRGAAFAVIIGEDEVANNTASVKAMRAPKANSSRTRCRSTR
jgi:histidyl-tRNA synthetase